MDLAINILVWKFDKYSRHKTNFTLGNIPGEIRISLESIKFNYS
jgi:hypothetical protein